MSGAGRLRAARRRLARACAAAAVAVVAAASFARATADTPAAVAVRAVGHVDADAAALLLSGQRGGTLDGAVARGPVTAGDRQRTVPFVVELTGETLGPGGPAVALALDVVVYALAADGGVETFLARSVSVPAAARARLTACGLRLRGAIAAAPTVTVLRVLVRDAGGDAFLLDEVQVPAGDAARFDAWVPAAGAGWVDASLAVAGDAAPVVEGSAPAGRAVVAAGGILDLVVVAPGGEAPALRALLRDHRRVGVEAAEVEVVGAAAGAASGAGLWQARWHVPGLQPGPYALELSPAAGTADGAVAAIEIVVVPPGAPDARPQWPEAQRALAALTAASAAPGAAAAGTAPPRPASRGAETAAYLAALHLLADGQRDAAMAAVLALEQRTIAVVRARTVGFRGAAGATERLAALEVDVVERLAAARPAAVTATLDLHVATLAEWTRRAEPLGRRHALAVVTALAQRCADTAPAGAATAAAALTAAADLVLDLNAPADALELLALATRLDPGHQAAALGAGAIHEWFGRYREAVAALDDAAAAAEPLDEVLLRRSVNLRRLGRSRDAREALGACLATARPTWVRTVAAEELALALLDDGDAGGASVLLASAAADPTTALVQAYAATATGDRAASRRLLDAVERRPPGGEREGPRLRYGRWSAEVFAGERAAVAAAGREARAALRESLDAAGGREAE
jgi:tetratricopeptide (TPR) repeat protein